MDDIKADKGEGVDAVDMSDIPDDTADQTDIAEPGDTVDELDMSDIDDDTPEQPYDDLSESEQWSNQQKTVTNQDEAAILASENKGLSDQQHLVPATAIERLDTVIDEKKAAEIAAHEYPYKSLQDLADANLRGVAYEGTVYRQLEDDHGQEHVISHPEGLVLSDGRSIEPDFVVTDDQGNPVNLVDAKGYTRKGTHNPDAAASSLTHMNNFEHASRYTEVTEPTVEGVQFHAPAETGSLPQVQEAVANLGQEDRPVSISPTSSEAELKQRMTDLQTDPAQRFVLSDNVTSEIQRIQSLPVEQRRAAMGEYILSLRDAQGDETTEIRNLRWNTRVERNGDGITIIGNDGEEHTVWYVDKES